MLSPIFWEVHGGLPRQGPGNANSTRKALDICIKNGLHEDPKILDIGCGPGVQTLDIHNYFSEQISQYSQIIAIDKYEEFLTVLREKIENLHLENFIKVENQDMANLNFSPETFDLIWSEGAIYIMGFEKGLREWKQYLKPHGILAVTEVSWLKTCPPEEVAEFWAREYPSIKLIDENIQIISNSGYNLLEYFSLPKEDWWSDYYHPMQEKLLQLYKKYDNDSDEEVKGFLKSCQEEIDMHKKYHDVYGYIFYIMQA